MSLRASAHLTKSVTPALRLNRISELHSAICPACLWRLQRGYRRTINSPRSLATVTAERPPTFQPAPPPRNAGVPDTSITSNNTETDNREREAQRRGRPPPPTAQHAGATISQREEEAQKPRSVKEAGGAGSAKGSIARETSLTSSPQAARKSKLRPRKAAMTLTPKAVGQLKDLLEQPDPKMIRVGVKNRGCSGLAYHLEYVDKVGMFDEAVEQDGVKVLIDSKALFSIIGSEMDWQEDKLSARFVFRNPNISKSFVMVIVRGSCVLIPVVS